MADERRSRRFHTDRWTDRTGPDAGSHLRGSQRSTWRRAIAARPPREQVARLGCVRAPERERDKSMKRTSGPKGRETQDEDANGQTSTAQGVSQLLTWAHPEQQRPWTLHQTRKVQNRERARAQVQGRAQGEHARVLSHQRGQDQGNYQDRAQGAAEARREARGMRQPRSG